mgnify:CR=1 FL=1
MLCSRMSLVRACCVRGQRERETERQRQTELFFLFLCTQPKVPTKVGGVPKNKTREQQAQAARQKKTKRRDFTYLSRERERERSSIYRRDFFKTVSTNQPKNFEKAKQDEKYLDALSEARSILPLFLKDQQKANGRNPCVTTLYSLFRGRRTPPNNNNAHVLF